MLYNNILSVVAAGTSMISLSVAAPLQQRNTPQCPAGTQYYNFESTSGFKGCTATPDAYKSAPRVFWGSCPPSHGSWYVCANGFSGCTTDVNVCNGPSTPATIPASTSPTVPAVTARAVPQCPAGTWYVDYSEKSGFIGCSKDDSLISAGPKRFWGSCPTGYGNYYNCANGFKGCTTDTAVCDPKPAVETPVVVVGETPKSTSGCPKNTSYVDYTATTGFKGCTATPEKYASGARQFWGSCPPEHGNWYVCSNGFSGCTTVTGVCGL